MLRDYQQRIVDATIDHIKESFDSCLIEAATGSGKSHVVSELANWIFKKSNKRVLCLAPSKELTEQNKSKFPGPCSYFSASVGVKSLRHHVVFGTPLTVLNGIERFKNFAAVIIDEAHEITPTIKTIIEALKKDNKNLRVIGLSATPYRMKSGYIYQIDETGKPTGHDGYFVKLVEKVRAPELIDKGYLTPPITDTTGDHYDTSAIDFRNQKTIEEAFEGHGRKTSKIVADIVGKSTMRRGVIIFSSSIKHAEEVMASLPHRSALVTGKIKKKERESILKKFLNQEIKYLVNVGVLTTGFDAPHVDVVAILRATESASLLQQMVGRGLRLFKRKKDCLVLDYAENIERHCPSGDLFGPKIKPYNEAKEKEKIEVCCPECHTEQEFFKRPNPDKFPINKNGYFSDAAGNAMPIPAHFGRRCFGQTLIKGIYRRCEYRWTFKECLECGGENDIAARRCEQCGEEIVDPNEKLRLEHKKLKRDPYAVSTDYVESWDCVKWTSVNKKTTLKVEYKTECRMCTVWYTPVKKNVWNSLCIATLGKIVGTVEEFINVYNSGKAIKPKTITVRKDKITGFFNVYDHNRGADEIPKLA